MDSFKDKKILITGATGLIGRHLTWKLLDAGACVIATGRSQEKLNQVFSNCTTEGKLFFITNDIAKSFPKIEQEIDYVFHASSPISGAEIRNYPVDTISANIEGIRNCLEYLKKQGHGRLIVFSSATAYGNYDLTEDMVVTEEMTSTADALHTSNSPYSESKRMIEVLARAYHKQYGVDYVTVRIAYVYGYTNPRPNTAFYEFIGKAIRGENIVLNASGIGRRDNIHVDDVVNGIILVAEKGKTDEAYNISSNGELGNFVAIDEIAEMIAGSASKLSKRDIKVIGKSLICKRKHGLKMDNTKTKTLGWNVNISITDGIEKTVSAYFDEMKS